MAEGEPQNRQSFHFQYGDQIVYGNNENTRIYTFTEEPLGNHIFVMDTVLEDNYLQGTSYWMRRFLENEYGDTWEDTFRLLVQKGVEVVKDDCLSRSDREYYRRIFGEPIVKRVITLPDFHELTPREEKRLNTSLLCLKKISLRPLTFIYPAI